MPYDALRKPILAVWTRELDITEDVGRVNVARQVRSALGEVAPVANRRLTNAFEGGKPLQSASRSVMALLAGLLSGRPLPLQCALFAASSRNPALLAEGREAETVYLDGIRTLLLLRRLRRASPNQRIVVDLDDLMSRRYMHLGRRNLPFSLGYLERMLPRGLARLALGKNITRLLLWYERIALSRAEQEILELADAVILLNRSEAATLQQIGRAMSPPTRASIAAIPPMAKPVDAPEPSPVSPRRHAIFIGSDMLSQNRVTIAHLLDLWETYQIRSELHIFGRQKTAWRSVPNVSFHGYVQDIKEAYQPGSVLVYPCLMPGGIKTKVLEAFAHRVPVIGNALTFEGILPSKYPLVINDQKSLVAVLNDLSSHEADFQRATVVASAYVEREHSPDAFAKRWQETMVGTPRLVEAIRDPRPASSGRVAVNLSLQ
jgi:hypothetical protein